MSWIFICLVYFPCNSPKSTFEMFFSIINEHVVSRMSEIDDVLFIGDFNLPKIKWSILNNELFPDTTDETSRFVLQCLDNYGVKNFNNIFNEHGGMLDLVFSSTDAIIINKCDDLAQSSSIFHTPLEIQILCENCDIDSYIKPSKHLDWRKGDYVSMQHFFENIDWDQLLYSMPFTDAVVAFENILQETIEKFIPTRSIEVSYREPWYNKKLLNLKNRQNRAHKKFKKTGSTADKKKYDICRKEFKFLNQFLHGNYLLEIETDIKSNPKKFFSFISSRRKTTGYPKVMKHGNTTLTDPESICNEFATFFQSVYTESDYFPNDFQNANILYIPLDDVLKELITIDVNKGVGPDNIHPLLFKNCANQLASPLHILYNESLRIGHVPDQWKISSVIPIYKSGSRCDIINYRGISILPWIAKLQEKLVRNQIQIEVSKVISTKQHGFLPGRSTVTNLLLFTNNAFKAIENNNQLDVVYTDFSKAFDKLDHKLVLEKLQQMNCALPLKWMYSYLVGRTQFVKIMDCSSEKYLVTSGVPQGSHLGPLIFISFENDFESCLKFCDFLMYADDIKLFMEIKTAEDTENFQNDIDNFSSWCISNKLSLNIDKCKVITYCKKRTPICTTYKINTIIVNRVSLINDLGVLFCSDLSFSKHIELIISKATAMLGFIKRCAYSFHDPYTIKTLYVTYVRSQLEYASVIWTPYQQTYIDRIESVQKQFLIYALRRLPTNNENRFIREPYSSRLQLISLQKLSTRRDIACSMFVRDTLCGRIDCPEILQLFNINVPSRGLRRREQFLSIPYRRTNYGFNEPTVNMMRLFNFNSESFDFNISREKFKSLISFGIV